MSAMEINAYIIAFIGTIALIVGYFLTHHNIGEKK